MQSEQIEAPLFGNNLLNNHIQIKAANCFNPKFRKTKELVLFHRQVKQVNLDIFIFHFRNLLLLVLALVLLSLWLRERRSERWSDKKL